MDISIKGDGYAVTYAPENHAAVFTGVLRLNGLTEYAPIIDLLRRLGDEGRPVRLDLRGLEFLNSSGIAMLSRYVIECRNSGTALAINGASSVAWQGKSLSNLQRLMPSLAIDLD